MSPQYARQVRSLQSAAVGPDTVVWRLPDPDGEWTGVRLWSDFDLGDTSVAAQVGYPLYMKPFDGGGWRGMSRVDNPEDLHRAYDTLPGRY